MKGILLVSHSQKITDGLKEMIEEMVSESSPVRILSLGGTEDQRLGTSAMKILDGIYACKDCEDIFIFCDIGSAIISAEVAIEMLEEPIKEKVSLVDAPLIEGAFAAAIQASIGDSKENIFLELSKI